MTDWVVDSCVAVKWVVVEPDSATAHRILTDVLAAQRTLYLVDIAPAEVANALRTKVRRKVITPAAAAVAFAQIQTWPVQLLAGVQLLPEAFNLALKYDIVVYDALFVAAVQHLGCGGVTADGPLHAAVAADFPQIKLLRHW